VRFEVFFLPLFLVGLSVTGSFEFSGISPPSYFWFLTAKPALRPFGIQVRIENAHHST